MSDDNVMDLRSSMHRDPSVSQLLETSSLVSVDGSSGSVSHIDWAGGVDESCRSGHDEDPVDDSESSRSMMGWSVVSHRAPIGNTSEMERSRGAGGRGRAFGLWGSALLPLGGHGGDHDDAAEHAAATSTEAAAEARRATMGPASRTSEEGRLQRRARLQRCARAVLIVAALAAFSGCVVYALEFYILPGEVIGQWWGEEGRRLPQEYSKDLLDEERMRRVEDRRKRRAERAGIRQRVTYRRAMVWDTTGPYIPQD